MVSIDENTIYTYNSAKLILYINEEKVEELEIQDFIKLSMITIFLGANSNENKDHANYANGDYYQVTLFNRVYLKMK